jgi:hypothetical protein
MSLRTRFIVMSTVVFAATAVAYAQQAPAQPQPPAKADSKPRRDVGKATVEAPTERVVATRTAATDSVNPKVEPGLVHWHPTFEAACTAARKSGKPVLLFHMMGKLDDQFC